MRVLDYLDVHCYPGALGVAFSSVGDDRLEALRLRSTRMLWDTTYVEEGWENTVKAIIPSMRALVDRHCAGAAAPPPSRNSSLADPDRTAVGTRRQTKPIADTSSPVHAMSHRRARAATVCHGA